MDKKVSITVKPDSRQGKEIKRIYSNYLEVSHTKFDFTLTFCEIDLSAFGRPDDVGNRDNIVVEIPIVAKIAIPAKLVPEVLDVLKKNYERYQAKDSE
jgi:hypothetical protein